MKRNLLVLILSLFSVALLIWSCDSNKNDEANMKVFKYNEAAGITSLDPAFSRNPENIWACNHLYNGLLEMDDQLNIKPSIAKRWEISEDGKTYTFYLHNNVFFHDNKQFENGKGRKVTAHDFVYSFNRILDSKVASRNLDFQ